MFFFPLFCNLSRAYEDGPLNTVSVQVKYVSLRQAVGYQRLAETGRYQKIDRFD